jgi:hypothetical protein
MTQTRQLSWLEVSQRAWGKEWGDQETAYEFNGRKFIEPRARTAPVEEVVEGASLYADNYADNYA